MKVSATLVLASLVIALSVFFVVESGLFGKDKVESRENTQNIGKILVFEDKIVKLEVVDTPEARQQGLSGRERLQDNMAMLFVFVEPDTYGIWMKDMLFDIDIVWLDPVRDDGYQGKSVSSGTSESLRVVHIIEGATPESFPTSFHPPEPASFVIEATSGFVKEHGIEIGQVLDVSTP